MKISRRVVLLSGLFGGAAATPLRFAANAAEFTFKCALNVPLSHPTAVRALEAFKGIEADSGGRLQIQVFPNNQLGDDTSLMTQLRSGAVQFYSPSGLTLATVVPISAIEGTAFAFPGYDKAIEALDGALGDNIRAGVRKAGLYPFDKMGLAGFHHVTNSIRPLTSPADMQGLKIRIPPGPIEVPTFKAMGATAAPIASAEMYSAMQTHVVDGAAATLAVVDSFKFFEVQKYLSLTRHLFVSHSLIANFDSMQGLPKNLHDVVDRNVNASALRQRGDIIRLDDTLEASLTAKGMTVNRPDLAPFKAAVRKAKLYEDWKAQFGAQSWGLLEKYVGSLA